jgi:hypothetical protein
VSILLNQNELLKISLNEADLKVSRLNKAIELASCTSVRPKRVWGGDRLQALEAVLQRPGKDCPTCREARELLASAH